MPSRLLSLLLLLFIPVFASAETFEGKVVGIADGDTITVLVAKQPVKVRLAEIDTPERGQPWGSRAKQALSDKVYQELVEVRVVTTDRYGRTVGHVSLGNRHINREMIREGHAWAYRSYLEDETLLDDEMHAKENRIGLWGLSETQRVPPWDWRRGKRENGPQATPLVDRTFSCSAKRRCGEMASCAEARFYLEKCTVTSLDGDGDGVPCESLCK